MDLAPIDPNIPHYADARLSAVLPVARLIQHLVSDEELSVRSQQSIELMPESPTRVVMGLELHHVNQGDLDRLGVALTAIGAHLRHPLRESTARRGGKGLDLVAQDGTTFGLNTHLAHKILNGIPFLHALRRIMLTGDLRAIYIHPVKPDSVPVLSTPDPWTRVTGRLVSCNFNPLTGDIPLTLEIEHEEIPMHLRDRTFHDALINGEVRVGAKTQITAQVTQVIGNLRTPEWEILRVEECRL
jgi:hypothetical protein